MGMSPGGASRINQGAGQSAAAAGAASPSAINRAQRFAVLSQSVEMTQQIYSQAVPSGNPAINVAPRNVGLVKGFIIQITGTSNNTGGSNTAAITDIGLANLISQIVFTDLNNNVRVQTAGWHLSMVTAMKHQWGNVRAILSSALIDEGNYGNNYPVVIYPTPAESASAAFSMFFYLPLAYSDDDLRGAVYMNVVNAVANIQISFNQAPYAATNTDSTSAVWYNTTGTMTGLTVTIWQVYLDQLPMGKAGPILPSLDLSTVYELKNTTFSAFVANQDFPMPYANFRDFLSTFVVYNHDPSANAGRPSGASGGDDINYFALQSANFTNIFKYPPVINALKQRHILKTDLPPGCYYFSSRRKPLSTTTYGNLELILNPVTAASGAYALVGWEDFALVNTLLNAGSLAG